MSRPGRLDRRVEVFRDTGATQDALGAHVEGWTLQGSRWAELQPGRGSERFAQESERASQVVTVVMRWDELTSTITPADRLRYTDSVANVFEYDIQAASDRFGEHRYLEILCALRSPEASRLP